MSIKSIFALLMAAFIGASAVACDTETTDSGEKTE